MNTSDWFSTLSDVWSGYVAAALTAGVYRDLGSIPAVKQPTPAEADEMAKLAADMLAQHGPAVSQVITSRARRRKKQRMEATLKDLGRHSRPLEPKDLTSIYAAQGLLGAISPDTANPNSERSGLPPAAGEVDRLVLAVARWFKHEYFAWADPVKCPLCGGETVGSSAEPTAEERLGGAGRCELYTCKKACGGVDRFPRYNEVSALMKSQRGRCGEFAQLFYFFLLVLGVEARYVWNSEDHVWTEYWSPELQHWVHVDSCEAEVNKPLLYARGWGKQQAYVIAFGRCGAEDVTQAYVDDQEANAAFRRRRRQDGSGISECHLRFLLLQWTVKCRALMGEEERLRLLSMDEAQARWMDNQDARWDEAERVNLHGRESGTKEWKEARGESGSTIK